MQQRVPQGDAPSRVFCCRDPMWIAASFVQRLAFQSEDQADYTPAPTAPTTVKILVPVEWESC